MSVDATGTPSTKFSIPKYNTGGDAPSGKGLNNIIDSLDTVLSNLGISSLVANDVPVYDSVAGKWKKATGTHDGTKFLRDDGTWAVPTASIGTIVAEGISTAATIPITSTVESTSTTLITASAFTADGTSAYYVEIFCAAMAMPTLGPGDATFLSLFEGATQITRMWEKSTSTNTSQEFIPVYAKIKITPAAGSHTYIWAGKVNSTNGTPGIRAGTSAPSDWPAAYIRITKAS